MVFLIAQQAPEPQWNTISRINSDAAYEILKKFCSSPSQKSECTVLWWWGRIITILVEFSIFWKGLHIMGVLSDMHFASRYRKSGLQDNWCFCLSKEHCSPGTFEMKYCHYTLGPKETVVLT